MENLAKEYKSISLSTSTKLKTFNAKDCKDSTGGHSQETVSIGRDGAGNVAMSRDNYTLNEISTQNQILNLIQG